MEFKTAEMENKKFLSAQASERPIGSFREFFDYYKDEYST